ncbi:MAG: MBL fold metallo-hydrolase [Myxococcales bacterium]|jgi:L-ascorbate metabolism protein UlaG (beta-lactamase superfamily)|nr:MBL fold metallo-hydrolase [Myxococcales bacterium]
MTMVLGLFSLALGPACATGHRGPITDHFDGETFSNQPGVPPRKGFAAALKMKFEASGAWPDHVDAPFGPKPPTRNGLNELRATFVGHATVLLQQDGVNILTDPVWSGRIGPYPWLGIKRRRPPGIRFEALPPIEVVLLSHDHFDHLDLPTIRRLVAAHPEAVFVMGLGTRAFLMKEGIEARMIELDWWQSAQLDGLEITAVPAAHWSGRGPISNRRLWVGFTIRGPSGLTYFAGDTGFGPHFEQIRERLGAPRLAILPIGAYRPRDFMSPQHIDPKEVVDAAKSIGAEISLPIHYGTFKLSGEGFADPIRDLAKALALESEPPRFWLLYAGEGRDL